MEVQQWLPLKLLTLYKVLRSTVDNNNIKYIWVLCIMSMSVFWPYFSCLQIASFLCRNRLSSVASLAVTYFSTLSHKGQYFRGKNFKHKIFFLYSFFWIVCRPKKHSLSRMYRSLHVHYPLSQIYRSLHVHYPLFLPEFSKTWIFSADLRKIRKYQIVRKSVQGESSCSMLTDRRTVEQTDMMKLIAAFRNFANVPIIW
jgi:hypothetical protein